MDATRLFDIAVEENVVPDEYFLHWDTFADWQFDALRTLGLEPHHRLLDIGCGALRLGSRAIGFLEPGHYYGIDGYEPLLRTGLRLMVELGVDKPYTTALSANFDFERFGIQFDYAIAQSVFTHLSKRQIHDCVENLVPAMNTGGTLLFTYTFLPANARRGLLYCGTAPMSAPVIESDGYFSTLAEELGLRFEPAPELAHPSQRAGLLRF